MSRAIRVKVDLGGWVQDEREATTVQVSVREDKGGSQVFVGIGVAILAPEDKTSVIDDADLGRRAKIGAKIALERALNDSGMPYAFAREVRKVVQESLDERKARQIGQWYYRVTRRVLLPEPSFNISTRIYAMGAL